MSGNRFLHFKFLPLSLRMVYTMTLLVLGTGYLFAMIQVFTVHAGRDGNPNLSANDLRIHFGLGTRKTIESLEITWLSGAVDKLTNVPINQIITVKEGEGIVPGNFSKVPSK